MDHYADCAFEVYHYFYAEGGPANMMIPGYFIGHIDNFTHIYKNNKNESDLIFKIPLLDMDYSKTYAVINRIKLLTTFS